MEGAPAAELAGMPEPWRLESKTAGGEVFVFRGPHLFARYEHDDLGMRNLAIIGLTNAGCPGKEVAACFGLTPQYVSMLRGRARDGGSGALVRRRGRHRSLSQRQVAKAKAWSHQGMSNRAIAQRLGVHNGTVGRRLAELATHETPEGDGALFDQDIATDGDEGIADPGDEATSLDGDHDEPAADEPAGTGTAVGLSDTEIPSRYAGAMLLHAFFTRLGAEEILASLPRSAARRYDTASMVLATTFSFALGTSSLEGTKHLVAPDAGALIGAASFPHLRTLRPSLKALAEVTDPIAVQGAFAKAMLGATEHPPETFYVDDHFVTYWGARPVAKGYNIRRHLAEPGRDDTFCVDDAWRVICFSSGEPRGLSVTLPGLLGQPREVTGDRKVLVGFDRGGAYPKVFSALADAGMDWVTWRRAPLADPVASPRRSWVQIAGKRKTLLLADELVTLSGYKAGPVRQLSAFEHTRLAFQVLTSNTVLKGAPLVHKLRGRWCIENTNKYLEDHHGIHWLATYDMDVEANTAMVKNPARKKALGMRTAARAALAEAERALGRCADQHVGDVTEHLAALSARRDNLTIAADALEQATTECKGIPAKVAANEIDKNATRAKPRLGARALQMVCRLLAYNAELDLARHLNMYLGDDDEYRAITRNLLHLGGRITYERSRITVTLDRPRAPRVARALGQLLCELASAPPARLAGDRRPIAYRLASS